MNQSAEVKAFKSWLKYIDPDEKSDEEAVSEYCAMLLDDRRYDSLLELARPTLIHSAKQVKRGKTRREERKATYAGGTNLLPWAPKRRRKGATFARPGEAPTRDQLMMQREADWENFYATYRSRLVDEAKRRKIELTPEFLNSILEFDKETYRWGDIDYDTLNARFERLLSRHAGELDMLITVRAALIMMEKNDRKTLREIALTSAVA